MEKCGRGLFFCIFLLISFSSKTQSTTFEKWYDYGFGESGKCVEQTWDGGYIIAGVQGIAMGVSKNLLIKTDSGGQVMWFKVFGGNNNNELWAVTQTFDKGYIMSGRSTGSQSNHYDISWIKTDSNGDTVWTNKLIPPGPTYSGYGKDVLATNDGGYLVLANSGDTVDFIQIIRTKQFGDTIWTRKFTGPYGILGQSIRPTMDSGYIISGRYTLSKAPPTFGAYLIKTNSNGDTLWTKILRDTISNNVSAYSAVQTASGGYFISGSNFYSNPWMLMLYLANLDSSGNVLWTKTYMGTEADGRGGGIQTLDGGYIVSGIIEGYGHGSSDVYLVKVDSSGNKQWERTFGTSGPDEAACVQQTSDSGFVVAGVRYTNVDLYLIKTDSEGNVITTGVLEDDSRPVLLRAFPNPFVDHTNILLPRKIKGKEDLKWLLFSVTGIKVREENIPSGDNLLGIDRGDLPTGIYLMQLVSRGTVLGSGKLLIN